MCSTWNNDWSCYYYSSTRQQACWEGPTSSKDPTVPTILRSVTPSKRVHGWLVTWHLKSSPLPQEGQSLVAETVLFLWWCCRAAHLLEECVHCITEPTYRGKEFHDAVEKIEASTTGGSPGKNRRTASYATYLFCLVSGVLNWDM